VGVGFAPLVAEAQRTIRLSPGESRSLSLVENRSTGYGWAVTDGGRRGEDMPGARLWALRALKSGRADIAFVYRRPWESVPVEARRIVVEVR
jgi:predicted secreted protein